MPASPLDSPAASAAPATATASAIHARAGTAARLAAELSRRNWRLAVAESLTGGGLGAACTALAGASTWFAGGVIVYQTEQKTRQLGVSEELIARAGLVSGECVQAMAAGVAARFAVDCALATSGIAGPEGGSAATPLGTVWIAARSPQVTIERCYHFAGGREMVRAQSVEAALLLLDELISSDFLKTC